MPIIQYYETEETQRLEFARAAAKYFEDNPASVTYTKNGLEAGEYMALRWGMAGDCVVVVKLHEYEPMINYCQFVDREKAEKYQKFIDAGERAIKS